MLKKGKQGVQLNELLKIGGLLKVRLLACQYDLENRIVRTITLLEEGSNSSEHHSRKISPLEDKLQVDQLVLIEFLQPPTNLALTDLLERVAKSDCAALIMHSKKAIKFPSSFIQKAETLGLPVFDLPSDISLSEIIAPVVDELISREHALLNQTTNIQERMVSQVLAGKGGQGIVDLLFTIIDVPILLIDTVGTNLGSAGNWHQIPNVDILFSPDRLISSLESLTNRGHQWYSPEDIFDLLPFGQNGLFARPIITGKEIVGWLILISKPKATNIVNLIALDQAVLAASIEIDRQESVRKVEVRMQANLLENLFIPNMVTGKFEERAHHLGWDLRHKKSVILVAWDEEDINKQHLRQVEVVVSNYILAWRPESLVLPREREIVVLPHLPEASDPNAATEILQDLFHGMLNDWPLHLKNISVVVAIGSIQSSLKGIVTSYYEAQRALVLRRRLGLHSPVVTFEDVRIFSLLENHLDDEAAGALYHRTLGPLAEYDIKHKTDLVRTAEVYFDCNYHLQQAADQLFIHPSSLKYRLQRIRDILATDPFNGKDHLDYYLATKIARLL